MSDTVVNKITEDDRKKWIEALRSGLFHQGTGCLYDSSTIRYCCLGVYRKVCMTKVDQREIDESAATLYSVAADTMFAMPLHVQRLLYGWNDGTGDGDGAPFTVIADALEKIPLEVLRGDENAYFNSDDYTVFNSDDYTVSVLRPLMEKHEKETKNGD